MFTEKIVPIVKEAASLMVRSGFDVMEKGSSANLVTSSDLAVQHFLVERLSALVPGCGFLCEEEDLDDIAHEYIWIIDPIDGTANYAREGQDCCISVALARNGKVCAGVVYSPWRDELYTAETGCGSFCNGRSLHVSGRAFEDGIFCTAMSTYRKEFAKTCSDIIYDVYLRSNDFRRYGSAAIELCMLASGSIELYFEMRLQPWDFAAASLIVSEAGGTLCGFGGRPLDIFKPGMVIGANKESSCAELVSTVGRYLPELPY
ncbi:MAG: inositol monophosphatase [Bacteroidales bacterium]|nr:inositol monophosphatase [Bacteroidales bacterium]